MDIAALAPYEDSLLTGTPLHLASDCGKDRVDFDVRRWLAPVDDADRSVLARCTGPVLDVGCGPGRFVRALAERNVASLGMDIAETAVMLTRRQGAPAICRSVFEPAPAEGRWPTVLLMDGNIGIGGDPARLLERIRSLLAPQGRLVVETALDAAVDRFMTLRFTSAGKALGPAFDWAEVGADGLRLYAARTGYSLGETWSAGSRTFLVLER